jgi:hypothetical protein
MMVVVMMMMMMMMIIIIEISNGTDSQKPHDRTAEKNKHGREDKRKVARENDAWTISMELR